VLAHVDPSDADSGPGIGRSSATQAE
jgi:hypothetical protein